MTTLATRRMRLAVVLATVWLATDVRAHGTVHDPVSRQTRWRYDRSAVANYDDNQLFCGGFYVQFSENGGRCGLCGDNWATATPRPHELGGKYGQGVVVKSYTAGGLLPVSVQLTANHLGRFVFKLCNLDADGGIESDECFEKNVLPLEDGSGEYALTSSTPGWYNVVLQLPAELRCEHCVLQWTYVAGNNWGYCDNGTGRLGCGPQEHFRACSDIRIE